jgi:site-specific recombinase XerD
MNPLDRFAAEYQEFHEISAQRRKDQLKELRAFATFAGKPIEQCTADDFSRYLGHLASLRPKLNPNTIAKKANMIRPFFRFGFQIGVISADTHMRVKEVPNPKESRKRGLPRPYNQRELRQLWADLDREFPEVEERWWRRWKKGTSRYPRIFLHVYRLQITAIIRLALDCGLRREEIFNLTIDDAHPDNAGVAVHEGKGGKDRQVPYTDEAREAVRAWLKVRRLFRPNHKRMWLSVMPNQPGGERMVRRPASFESFEKFLRKVGAYELHRLRHTCATNWVRSGMPIHIVKDLLGHEDIQQTLLYTKIIDDDLQKAVEQHQGAFEKQSGREAE